MNQFKSYQIKHNSHVCVSEEQSYGNSSVLITNESLKFKNDQANGTASQCFIFVLLKLLTLSLCEFRQEVINQVNYRKGSLKNPEQFLVFNWPAYSSSLQQWLANKF